MGELARIMTGAGLIFITAIENLDKFEQEKLEKLNFPNDIVTINIGNNSPDAENADLLFEKIDNTDEIVNTIMKRLNKESIIPEYCI